MTKEQMCIARRGTENLPHDLAIYLVRINTREPLAVVGSYFGIGKYSTVSSAVERVKLRKQKDEPVRKHLSTIRDRMDNSQRET